MKRISWEKLKIHPFFSPYEIMSFQIPPQPHFESWVKSKKSVIEEIKIKKAEKEEVEKNEIRNPSQALLIKNAMDKEINLLRFVINIILL